MGFVGRAYAVRMLAGVLVLGCGHDTGGPGPAGGPSGVIPTPLPPAPGPVGQFIGSAVLEASSLGSLAPPLGAGQTAVLVSASPGSFPGVWLAHVSNQRSGERTPVTLVDGGFDPVALGAAAGDSLALELEGGGTSEAAAARAREPVRVVRTRPAPTQTDVPLNARIEVVFSAPVPEGSMDAITLAAGGGAVPVTVVVLDPGRVSFEVVPVEGLQARTAYTLEIAATLTDIAGNALPEPVSVSFRTGDAPPPVPTDNLVLLVGAPAWLMHGFQLQPHVSSADGLATRALGYWSAYDLAWSPDRRWIAIASDGPWYERPSSYYASQVEIIVMAADGSRGYQVTRGGYNFRPRWRPDGQTLVFDHFGPDPLQWGSYSVTPTGAGRRRLTGLAPRSWSPDGTRIAGQDDQGIWVANADGSGRVLAAPGGFDPAWSPRGDLIAYAMPGEGAGLFVMAPDGSGRRQVAAPPAYSGGPVWSPDGSQLLFHESTEDEQVRAFKVNADGSGLVPLPLAADTTASFRVYDWR